MALRLYPSTASSSPGKQLYEGDLQPKHRTHNRHEGPLGPPQSLFPTRASAPCRFMPLWAAGGIHQSKPYQQQADTTGGAFPRILNVWVKGWKAPSSLSADQQKQEQQRHQKVLHGRCLLSDPGVSLAARLQATAKGLQQQTEKDTTRKEHSVVHCSTDKSRSLWVPGVSRSLGAPPCIRFPRR